MALCVSHTSLHYVLLVTVVVPSSKHWSSMKGPRDHSIRHNKSSCSVLSQTLTYRSTLLHMLSFLFIWATGCRHSQGSTPSKHETLTQCCFHVDPASAMLEQHWTNFGWTFRVCWEAPATIKLHASDLPCLVWLGKIDIMGIAVTGQSDVIRSISVDVRFWFLSGSLHWKSKISIMTHNMAERANVCIYYDLK